MADIDFANADSRMAYLKDNLGHLMNGIDKNYGQVLMNELMRRLEATVSDFNEEVKAMLSQLQGVKTMPRDNIMGGPKAAPKAPAMPVQSSQPMVEVEANPTADISEFEKRLQSLDQ
ncbi:MAG: hypothetical protein L3J79_08055 [Candidatus Marinimicrobia bacterium]|nr:hypothetical protein [Candidatus Neomarinimicrobiota bacterium]